MQGTSLIARGILVYRVRPRLAAATERGGCVHSYVGLLVPTARSRVVEGEMHVGRISDDLQRPTRYVSNLSGGGDSLCGMEPVCLQIVFTTLTRIVLEKPVFPSSMPQLPHKLSFRFSIKPMLLHDSAHCPTHAACHQGQHVLPR